MTRSAGGCTRRHVLRSLVGGSLLLPGILSELLAAPADDPLAPKKPHFEPRAKRMILLFSTGGVSQMDTFDPKPKLFAADGKTMGAGVQHLPDFALAHRGRSCGVEHHVLDLEHVERQPPAFVQGMRAHGDEQDLRALRIVAFDGLAAPRQRAQQPRGAFGALLDLIEEIHVDRVQHVSPRRQAVVTYSSLVLT